MVFTTSVKKCSNPNCDVGEPRKNSACEMAEKCASACAAYGRVCPCAARAAAKAAHKAIEKLTKDSDVFKGDEPDFVKLNCDDLVIGKKLGEGGFSQVNLVEIVRGEEAGKTYAIKYLKRKAMVDQHTFELGAADLAVEAHFLYTLSHKNIVKLIGVTAGSIETNIATGKEHGFFLVVDRLFDTLEQRIEKLGRIEEERNNSAGILQRRSHAFKAERRQALNDRLKIAIDIADTMEYLHHMNIIFRDLKPDNIGFDEHDNIKLFDFGLAKELKKGLQRSDGKYDLTGNTGSRRYMAPEVAREMNYDKSVDVYSFGILLWELAAMEKPFYGFSAGKHQQQVVIGGDRPRLDAPNTSWFPMNLQWLLKKCWSSFPVSRPDFALIKRCLQEIIDGVDHVPQIALGVVTPSEGFTTINKASRERYQTEGPECANPKPTLALPKGGMKTIPKPSKDQRRAKTWGFGGRR